MSDNGSEDEFELSNTASPPALADLLQHPFRALIEAAQPIFTGRVTKSRTGAIPPLENPNNDFPDDIEIALQNQDADLTARLAPRARNLGTAASNFIFEHFRSSVSDYLILSSYVCSNVVANVVTNTYVYVMRHVRAYSLSSWKWRKGAEGR